MPIAIIEVTTPQQLRSFIQLPAKLHKNSPNWMPTIDVDDKKFFNPLKNHQFDSCDTILALAYIDGKAVGRIMGIIHHTYNNIRNENNARFGYFDSIDNQDVAHALFNYIKTWAKKKNKTVLIGPYGFSDKDVQGLLIEGFEHLPLVDSACNPPYIVTLVENEGFVKEVDCLTYKFPVNIQLPESYTRIQQRIEHSNGIEVLEFTKTKHLKPYIKPVLELVNITYDHLYGFVPMTDTEINELVGRYLPILDPRFVKIITKDKKVIAFIVAIPNLTKGIQRSGGRLYPIGIFYVINAMHNTTQIDLMLGAVQNEFQKTGIEVMLALKLLDSALKAGFKDIETHLILETNKRMRAEMERLNIPIHKRFRIYQTSL